MRSALSLLALSLVTTLLSSSASHAAKPADAWVSSATIPDFYATWPEAAHKAGIGGRVVTQCHVEDSGALTGCEIVRETPAGMGFGVAMLSMIPKYRVKPPGPNDPRTIRFPADWFEFDAGPDWLKKPTAEQLLAVWPRTAGPSGGSALISCIVTVQGTLTDCVPLSETPVGSGFGAAAVALTPQFLMKPGRFKGAPAVSTVSLPVTWRGSPAGADIGAKAVAPASLPWVEAPSLADVAAAYPVKARAANVAGHTTLNCNMSEEGRLIGCTLVSSSPGGYGFDGAAKQLARRFRYEVTSPQDKAATHKIAVQIPFTFDPAMVANAAPMIGRPRWASRPNADQLRTAFSRLPVTGPVQVSLACKVQPDGSLAGCMVERETAMGVGAAALNLVGAYRVSTWTDEGLPMIGGIVQLPIAYDPPPAR